MIKDQTELTDPHSQRENFSSEGFHLKGALHGQVGGFPWARLTCGPWIVRAGFCFSFSKSLFDLCVQGNKNRVCEAEASSRSPAPPKLYTKSRGKSVHQERKQKWASVWQALVRKTSSLHSRDKTPTNMSDSFFSVPPMPKELGQPTDAFLPALWS